MGYVSIYVSIIMRKHMFQDDNISDNNVMIRLSFLKEIFQILLRNIAPIANHATHDVRFSKNAIYGPKRKKERSTRSFEGW